VQFKAWMVIKPIGWRLPSWCGWGVYHVYRPPSFGSNIHHSEGGFRPASQHRHRRQRTHPQCV